MDRRYLLAQIILGTALLSCTSKDENEKLDHVILAVNNLEKGISQFKNLTGVEPVFGGVHPNSYTQNAIISLGNRTYIELLAPRTDVDSIPDWILKIDTLTPIGWAVSANNVQLTRQKLEKLNLRTSDPLPGSRRTSAGDTLRWVTFGIDANSAIPFPFFINWNKDSTHPSTNSPMGCRLQSLKILSDSSDVIGALARNLNLPVSPESARQNKIVLVLDTPKGRITFD